MLVVENVSKSFGEHRILKGISFSLSKGEIVALVGPNGAGKTTLMRCLSGFYHIDDGKIHIGDISLQESRVAALAKISYVPELGGLYPEMTVFEYLLFMAKLKHLPKTEFLSQLRLLLDRLDLKDVLQQKCETLSKGYKKRVALAGAMLSRPDLLILDEPTEGLDLIQKKQLRSFLLEYGANHAILISTHVMEEVEALAQRILVLSKGMLVCDKTARALKEENADAGLEETFQMMVEE